jgi:XTP/dITP diphosphohydrolase
MRVLFATSNPHKVEEVRSILAPLGVDVFGLESLGVAIPEPEETGATFEENAAIKARAYAAAAGCPALADDSGLEVDALGGAPGVHSARFAGVGATRAERDEANNRLLLERLQGVPEPKRTARFVCVLTLARPDGSIMASARGTMEGVIGHSPRGRNGFGYDPLLVLSDAGCTSAELEPEAKNARSHRGAATRALAAMLRESLARSD